MSRAAVFTGRAGELVLQEFPLPTPRGREVLVEVLGCTLCGSDLHSLHARRLAPSPSVLGHEIVGRVAVLGAAPPNDARGRPLQVGDRVTWTLAASCGQCFYCQRRLPQKCEHLRKYGHQALGEQPFTGGLAEHCLLAEGTSIVVLPESLPLAVACPANCATATAAAAIEAAGDLRDGVVAITGAGMLGLSAAAMLSRRGVRVIAIDVQPERLELARAFGAEAAVTPAEAEATIRSGTDGRGADAAIEMSGATAAMDLLWQSVRTGAAISVIGAVFPTDKFALSPEDLVRRQLTLRGVHNYRPDHLLTAVDFLTEAHLELPLADLVAAWHPLEEVAEAASQAESGVAIRVGVHP